MDYRDRGRGGVAVPKTMGIRRCPHCGIAHPVVIQVWDSDGMTPRSDGRDSRAWSVNMCISCGSLITTAGSFGWDRINQIVLMFPPLPDVAGDLPDRAQTYLRQAYETRAAPDASAVMSASAVDAMLKAKGYEKGSIYDRINKARDDHLLTADMAEWAHHVRLEANRPRHADSEDPHISVDEAQACLDFAESLGNFLFVITGRVTRGLQKAKETEQEVGDSD